MRMMALGSSGRRAKPIDWVRFFETVAKRVVFSKPRYIRDLWPDWVRLGDRRGAGLASVTGRNSPGPGGPVRIASRVGPLGVRGPATPISRPFDGSTTRTGRAPAMSHQGNDRVSPELTSRRGLLREATGAVALGALASRLGSEARAEQSGGTASKNGRIKQSIVHWCFAKYWDIPQAIEIARQLGCGSIELIEPKYFPLLKKAGLECAIGQIDMNPDPPFAKGFNNPKYHDRVIKADQGRHRLVRRVRLQEGDLLHRLRRGDSQRRRSQELRRGVPEGRPLRREEGHRPLPGDAQLAGRY